MASELKAKWAKILEENDIHPSYESIHDNPIRHFTMYVDETEFKVAGNRYMAISIAQTDAAQPVEGETKRVYDEYIMDPFSAGRKHNLEKKRLHYTDAHYNLRNEYVSVLETLPFDGYIAFCRIPDGASYKDTYLGLVQSMLPNRFRGLDRAMVLLRFEENPKVPSSPLFDIVEGVWGELNRRRDRAPLYVKPDICTKQNCYGLSVPDFLLGLFSKYVGADKTAKPASLEVLQFEKLRDKIRIIYDADNDIFYTRKRPFISIEPI